MRGIGKCLVATLLAFLWLGLVGTLSSTGRPAQTFSGGRLTANTTLTSSDSPYLITQNITVPAGIKLTLEPGTILKLTQGRFIVVRGELTAEGTPEQPITLTHDQEGVYWGGIEFWHTTANNYLSYVVVEYVSSTLGIAAMTSTLTIEQSEIRHTRGSAVNFIDATGAIRNSRVHDTSGPGNLDGIHVARGYVEIEGNQIYDGYDYFDAIDVDGDGTTSGLIRQNIIHNSNNDCIDLDRAAPQIEANYLYNCADKGISLGVSASPTIVNNLIYNSSIGIASKDGSRPVLINNTIVSNQVGIKLYRKVTTQPGYATVYNSMLWGNDTSIQLRDGSVITVTYSDVQTTTIWPGEGNINADPQFWAPASFDFRLKSTSPCTDAADAAVAPATDIRGVARPHDEGVDMGAFEFFERVWHFLPLIER